MTTELAALFVADLIFDPDFETVTPAMVEDYLKMRAYEARYFELTGLEDRAPGGVTKVNIYVSSPYRWWSNDTKVYDYDYNQLAPDVFLQNDGRWEFNIEPTPPVYALGFSFDPYGTAHDLLIREGATLKKEPSSFSVLNGSFTFQEAKRRGPLDIASSYLAMSRRPVATGL